MKVNSLDQGRRRHARVGLDAYISATLTTDKTAEERIFTTKDIGPDGIFIACKGCFPVGTILNLRVHTPTTLETINVQAKVIRIAKDENLNSVGMGLIFIEMSEDVKK
jgi:c-di-GMP-binding flagellar brake protein YcgR